MIISQDAIASLRAKCLLDYENNPEMYHENDIDNITNKDWPVERFLLTNKSDEEAAFKQLKKAMAWRKSFGVYDRDADYFPKELYQIGGAFLYGRDKEGRQIMHIRGKNYLKTKELTTIGKQFIVHLIEQMDSATSHQGWVKLPPFNYRLINFICITVRL